MKRGIVENGNKADRQVHQYFPKHKKKFEPQGFL